MWVLEQEVEDVCGQDRLAFEGLAQFIALDRLPVLLTRIEVELDPVGIEGDRTADTAVELVLGTELPALGDERINVKVDGERPLLLELAQESIDSTVCTAFASNLRSQCRAEPRMTKQGADGLKPAGESVFVQAYHMAYLHCSPPAYLLSRPSRDLAYL